MSYQSRGRVPSAATATALRGLVNALGDHAVARALGQSRTTVARLVARLPVNESSLFAAEQKIPGIVERASSRA